MPWMLIEATSSLRRTLRYVTANLTRPFRGLRLFEYGMQHWPSIHGESAAGTTSCCSPLTPFIKLRLSRPFEPDHLVASINTGKMWPVMRSVLLLAWAQLGWASLQMEARQQSNLTMPACATQCLASSLPLTSCGPTDMACLCADQSFLAAVVACVQGNCTVKEALTTTRIQMTELCPQPVRDESHSTRDIVWSLFGIAAFSVIARLVSRSTWVGGSGYGWDDWTILLALILLVPLNIMVHLMTMVGLGQDIWMVEFDNITNILYYFWIDEYLYTFILNITKIAILLLYLRMWPDADSRKFRNACLVLIGILTVHALAMNIALAAGCQPISYSWNQWDGEHEGHCVDYLGQIYGTAALNIFFDLLVFLLPLPKLFKLSFSSARKKLALCLTFMLGLFVTVCSIVRLQYLTVWGESQNLSWGYNPIAVWSIVECNASVLCACMPALAGLLQRIWAKTFGTPISRYGRSSVTAREDDEHGSDCELHQQLASPSGRIKTSKEKRLTLTSDTEMSPDRSLKTQVARYDSDMLSLSSPGSPFSSPGKKERNSQYGTTWHTTQPLPRLSTE